MKKSIIGERGEQTAHRESADRGSWKNAAFLRQGIPMRVESFSVGVPKSASAQKDIDID